MINWTKVNIPITGKLVKKDKANQWITELEKIENLYINIDKQLQVRESYATVAKLNNEYDKLLTNGNELLLLGQEGLFSFGENREIYRGPLQRLAIEKVPIAQYIDSYYSPQGSENATIFMDKENYLYMTIVLDNGQQIMSAENIVASPISRPAICKSNHIYYITFCFDDKLWLKKYNSLTDSFTSSVEVASLDESNIYSLDLIENKPIVAYKSSTTKLGLVNLVSPAGLVELDYYPTLLDLTDSICTFIEATGDCTQLNIFANLQSSSRLVVALTSVDPDDCTQIAGSANSIFLEETPVSTPYIYRIDCNALVPTDELVLLNHFLVSTIHDNRLILLPNINNQGTYLLVNSNLIIESALLPEAAGAAINSDVFGLYAGYLGRLSEKIALREKTRIESENNELYTEKGIVQFSIRTSEAVESIQLDNLLINTGGMLKQYDGAKLLEVGFTQYPEFIGSPNIQSGGSILAGTYAYCLVYEALDNKGNIIRSAPSFYEYVDIVSDNSKVTFVAPSIQLHSFPAKLALYRTESLGQIFYKVAEVDNSSTISISITDTLGDTSILSRELLYTTGGIFENGFPPAATIIQKFQNRIFLVSAENKNRLYFSKKIKPYKEALAFTLLNTIELQKGEVITALADMDDKLIIFTQDSIKVLTGEGPSDNGTGEPYAYPYSLTINVGTSNQRSICKYKDGIIFQANNGTIYLLSRSLSVQDIGTPVKDYEDYVVQSAIVREKKQQVHMLVEKQGIQKKLIWSFEYNRWFVFSDLPSIVEANTIYSLGKNELLEEAPSQENIKAIWESGWVQLDINKQSYQKVRNALVLLQSKSLSPVKCKLDIFYDWSPSSAETFEFTIEGRGVYGEDDGTYGVSETIQRQFNFKRQKCQAFKIRITIETSDSNFGISAITLEVGDLRTIGKLAKTKKVRGES